MILSIVMGFSYELDSLGLEFCGLYTYLKQSVVRMVGI